MQLEFISPSVKASKRSGGLLQLWLVIWFYLHVESIYHQPRLLYVTPRIFLSESYLLFLRCLWLYFMLLVIITLYWSQSKECRSVVILWNSYCICMTCIAFEVMSWTYGCDHTGTASYIAVIRCSFIPYWMWRQEYISLHCICTYSPCWVWRQEYISLHCICTYCRMLWELSIEDIFEKCFLLWDLWVYGFDWWRHDIFRPWIFNLSLRES
jgi:hypothetical protein